GTESIKSWRILTQVYAAIFLIWDIAVQCFGRLGPVSVIHAFCILIFLPDEKIKARNGWRHRSSVQFGIPANILAKLAAIATTIVSEVSDKPGIANNVSCSGSRVEDRIRLAGGRYRKPVNLACTILRQAIKPLFGLLWSIENLFRRFPNLQLLA